VSASHLLSFKVDVVQQFVGEAQTGYRIDLYYSGESSPLVFPNESEFPELRRLLKNARILSGNDWVTINSDAVIDFDSRITVAITPGEKFQCPIAVRLRGRASLRDILNEDGSSPFESDQTPSHVLDRWRLGFDNGSDLPLLLSASFDVPQRGFDARQDETYNELRGLASSLFIGSGQGTFQQAPHGSVRTIKLDLYKVKPVPSQSAY
jgi:hypothetical protein